MKTTQTIGLAVLLALGGCAPSGVGIEIVALTSNFEGGSGSCVAGTARTPQRVWGSLNLAQTSSYYLIVGIANDLTTAEVLDNTGKPINTKERNDFILESVTLDYDCKDTTARCAGFPRLPKYETPVAGILESGGEVFLPVDMMAAEAAQQLADFIQGGEPVTITANVSVSGSFRSGGSTTTEPFAYPIKLYYIAKPTTCPDGYAVSALDVAPCGNYGQDGTDYSCRPSAAGP